MKRANEGENEPKGEKKQFTAASMLKSAYEENMTQLRPADFKIADLDELRYFQQKKRSEYENALRRNRFNFGQWLRYAQFEVDQKDTQRARSIFERAIEVDYKNVTLWMRYIQSEIKGKNINHARNLLERATKLLPRIDKLWYTYITVEESIGNVVAVNTIFEKWLQWKPVKNVWFNYIEFKERYEEYDEGRLIFEKLVTVFNETDCWVKWTEYEKKYGDFINVENVFKLGVNSLYSQKKLDAEFIIHWIRFEYVNKRNDKVKELYEFGFNSLSTDEMRKLKKFQTEFKEQFGVDTEDIGVYVLEKRKIGYEEKLSKNPRDYETWWTYLSLLADSQLAVKETDLLIAFEASIKNIPDSTKLSEWVQFWYLNLRYCMHFEFEVKDLFKVRSRYEELARIIPHKEVNIIQFWIKYAEFELRNFDLASMRKVLGQSIGITSSEEIVKHYIGVETRLKYFTRARKLYNKLVEIHPGEWRNWVDYFNFEMSLGNDARAYSIIEVCVFDKFVNTKGKKKIVNKTLDTIVENFNFKLGRRLVDYKIELSDGSVDAIIERCLFELKVPSDQQIEKYESDDNTEFIIDDPVKEKVKEQYEKYIIEYKDSVQKRILLLESLKKFEEEYGNETTVEKIESRLPKIVKKVKEVDGIQEEYIEYVFPEDEQEICEQIEDFKSGFMVDDDDDDDDDDDEQEWGEEEETEAEKGKGLRSRFVSDDEREDTEEEGENAYEEPVAKTFKSRFDSDSEDEEDEK